MLGDSYDQERASRLGSPNSQRKSYARSVSSSRSVKKGQKTTEPIIFLIGLGGVQLPLDDVVITMKIADYVVQRLLVDTGIFCDVMSPFSGIYQSFSSTYIHTSTYIIYKIPRLPPLTSFCRVPSFLYIYTQVCIDQYHIHIHIHSKSINNYKQCLS